MSALAVGCTVLVAAIGGWPFVALIAIAAAIATRWFGLRILLHIPLAIAAAYWVGQAQPADIDPAVAERNSWRLEVVSMPVMRAQGWSFEGKIRDGAGEGIRVLVYSFDDHGVAFGDDIYVTGVLQPRDTLDDASYRGYLDGRGVSAQIYVGRLEIDRQGTGPLAWFNRQRQAIVNRALNAAPGDAGSLITGLVTGDDGKLAAQTDLEFTRSGLTHLTAISGANLAFAVALFIDMGTRTRARKSHLLVGGMLLAWTYAAFVGLSPPTLRAALMTTAVTGGRIAGRPSDPLSLAAITAALQLVIRPNDAHSISFLLSVVASMGLASALNTYPHDARRPVSEWIRAAVVAQIATFPVIAATFGQVSLLAIPANILAAPVALIAFPLSCASLALLTVSDTLGSAFVVPVTWWIDVLLGISRIFGQEWAMVEISPVDSRIMLAGVMTVMFSLFALGGEGRYLRRNARRRAPVLAPAR